jgi:hypothetical protein
MQESQFMSTVVFWVLALGLLVLPLWPTLLAWFRPSGGLSDQRGTPWAEFDTWLQTQARLKLLEGATRGDNRQTLPGSPHALRVLGEPEAWWRQQRGKAIHEGLLSAADLNVPDDTVCPWEVASLGDVKLGRRVQAGAVVGVDLVIGHDARVFQWAQARQTLRVLTGAHLDGSCRAGQQLLLADDVSFSRLHAPLIKVASESDVGDWVDRRPSTLPTWQPDQGEALDDTGQTWRCQGNVTVPPRVRVAVALIVEGDLHISQGAVMQMPVKVKGRTTVDAYAQLEASLVSVGTLAVGAGCQLAGPVLCESALFLGRAVVVGSEHALSTVSAPQINLAEAVTVHGSICARDAGRVVRA